MAFLDLKYQNIINKKKKLYQIQENKNEKIFKKFWQPFLLFLINLTSKMICKKKKKNLQ